MNTVEIVIEGRSFKLYRKSTQLVIDALGVQAFSIKKGAEGDPEIIVDGERIISGYDLMKKILKKAMFDPVLGDHSDDNTVTWYEIGDHVKKFFDAVMEDSEEANFTASLEVLEGSK